MPNISKVKKQKKLNLPTPKKTKRTKKDPVAYYQCLKEQAQAGFPNKITACCQNCKTKAVALTSHRKKEIQKLTIAYQQIGESLSKLLAH